MRTLIASAVIAAVLLPAAASAAQIVDEQRRRDALKHYREGQQLLFSESWDEAEREFRAAIELEPMLAVAYYGLGQVFMQSKRYPQAIEAFESCLRTEEKLAGLAGSQRESANRMRQDSINELRESIRLLRSGKLKVADAEHQIMRIEERVNELERGIRRDQDRFEPPPELSLSLGSAYFHTGKLPEAERAYLSAVEVRPNFGEAHNNLAVVYMMTGRLDEAMASLKRAERAGFKVNPRFKRDLEQRIKDRK